MFTIHKVNWLRQCSPKVKQYGVLILGGIIILVVVILCATNEHFTNNDSFPYNVVICGLVRNSKGTITKNLDNLEKIAKPFQKSHFILIENDSTDKTPKLLKKWAQKRKNVTLISDKMDVSIESTNYPDTGHKNDYSLSRKRFEKMAVLRNLYLQNLPKFAETDEANTWILVVDLDLKSIPVEDTLNVLYSLAYKQWDAVCANGVISSYGGYVKRRDNGKSAKAYDTLATRMMDDDLSQNYTILDHLQSFEVREKWNRHQRNVQKFMRQHKDDEEVQVKSCFGGLAIYKAAKLRNLKYTGEDCEHISIHKHMNSIKILPQFNVYYN